MNRLNADVIVAALAVILLALCITTWIVYMDGPRRRCVRPCHDALSTQEILQLRRRPLRLHGELPSPPVPARSGEKDWCYRGL